MDVPVSRNKIEGILGALQSDCVTMISSLLLVTVATFYTSQYIAKSREPGY